MRSRALALALALALAMVAMACAPPRSRPPAPVAVDTLFYISARHRDPQGRPRLADSLEYGLALTRRPPLADPTRDAADIPILDSVRLTRTEFVQRLRERLGADSSAFALLYTHGYGTSLHNLWQHSALARIRARTPHPWVVFAWPSIGSGIAWPRDGDILITAYRADSAAAAASVPAYGAAVSAVVDAIGAPRLMLVAHSLGGQMVGEALRTDSTLRARLGQDPLRALAFVSPDVEVTRFGEIFAPALVPLARRVLLYASADDRVLAMSQQVNNSVRAGRFVDLDRGVHVFPGVESVDMTDAPYANSWVVNTFGTRHALRRKSGALFDLVHIVGAQRTAECRLLLGTGLRRDSGAWVLAEVATPSLDALARCDGGPGPVAPPPSHSPDGNSTASGDDTARRTAAAASP